MRFFNAYIVVIFACCREIFLVTQHSECISLAERNEITLKKRLQDKRRLEKLMQQLTVNFANIVEMKMEHLNNDSRQK